MPLRKNKDKDGTVSRIWHKLGFGGRRGPKENSPEGQHITIWPSYPVPTAQNPPSSMPNYGHNNYIPPYAHNTRPIIETDGRRGLVYPGRNAYVQAGSSPHLAQETNDTSQYYVTSSAGGTFVYRAPPYGPATVHNPQRYADTSNSPWPQHLGTTHSVTVSRPRTPAGGAYITHNAPGRPIPVQPVLPPPWIRGQSHRGNFPPNSGSGYTDGERNSRVLPTVFIPNSKKLKRLSMSTPLETIQIASPSQESSDNPHAWKNTRDVGVPSPMPDQPSPPDSIYRDDSDAEEEVVGSSSQSLVADTNEDILLIDHNFVHSQVAEPPAWYISDPVFVPRGDPKHMCGTCRHINIKFLYAQGPSDILPHAKDFIRLGTLFEFLAKWRDCGLCHFFMRLIAFEVTTQRFGPLFTTAQMADAFFGDHIVLPSNLEMEYYMYPVQFKHEYNVPGLYICRGPLPSNEYANIAPLVRPDFLLGLREVHSCCHAPNTGRYIPTKDTIDFEWIKEELRLCDERSVGYPTSADLTEPIRVIDVHDMCIVDLKDDEIYATLSYVWGNTNNFELVCENESLLRERQGIRAFWELIPKTVRDAIILTRNIGLDYLWVDALCILQDSPTDKARQIQSMGDTYGKSYLTIIAQCGEDANYGLPGVEAGSRNVRQILGLAGPSIVCNMLPGTEDFTTKWQTRAWTMQENALSQRKLIINDYCCKFWCWHTTSTEDTYCRHKYWKVGETFRSMLFFKADHSSLIRTVRRQSNFDMYAFMVSDYTQRNMTKPEDAENAMIGIFHHLEGRFEGKFLYGLPDTEIDSALFWFPTGSSYRRVDKHGKALFPSWSYLGWVGHACFPWATDRKSPLSANSCPVRWCDADSDGNKTFTTSSNRSYPDFKEKWERVEDDPWIWKKKPHGEHDCWNPISYHRAGKFLQDRAPHRLQLLVPKPWVRCACCYKTV